MGSEPRDVGKAVSTYLPGSELRLPLLEMSITAEPNQHGGQSEEDKVAHRRFSPAARAIP